MIEYRTQIIGEDTREVYEEYSPVGGFNGPPLEVRSQEAAKRVFFWSTCLDAVGIGEPLAVVEDRLDHTTL